MRNALFVCLALTVASSAWAQGSRPVPVPTPVPPAKVEKAKEDKTEDRWLAVHAGTVHPVVGPVLRDVTILAKNGSIAAIGSGLVLPEGTEVLDARDAHVYPGLVAFDSGGIVGPLPADSTDVYGLNMTMALATGITTVGAGSTICKLTYGTLEGHILGRRALISLSYRGSGGATLRKAMDKARDHLRKTRAYKVKLSRGEKLKPPAAPKGAAGMYLKLLTGEARALIRARTVRELTEFANLAIHYGFSAVVTGGEEAWTVAPLLGRAGFSVLVVPRSRRREDQRRARPSGWSIENAARLHGHGVPIAIMSQSKGIGTGGLAGRDLFTLPLEAAFAVRGGLSEAAALEAITLGPARMLGVADQIGSIEIGKDCDLVIARGDLLHYQTLPQWTVVNGRIAYDKEKDSLLRAVRSRNLNGENIPLPQIWPRPKGTAQPDMPESETGK